MIKEEKNLAYQIKKNFEVRNTIKFYFLTAFFNKSPNFAHIYKCVFEAMYNIYQVRLVSYFWLFVFKQSFNLKKLASKNFIHSIIFLDLSQKTNWNHELLNLVFNFFVSSHMWWLLGCGLFFFTWYVFNVYSINLPFVKPLGQDEKSEPWKKFWKESKERIRKLLQHLKIICFASISLSIVLIFITLSVQIGQDFSWMDNDIGDLVDKIDALLSDDTRPMHERIWLIIKALFAILTLCLTALFWELVHAIMDLLTIIFQELVKRGKLTLKKIERLFEPVEQHLKNNVRDPLEGQTYLQKRRAWNKWRRDLKTLRAIKKKNMAWHQKYSKLDPEGTIRETLDRANVHKFSWSRNLSQQDREYLDSLEPFPKLDGYMSRRYSRHGDARRTFTDVNGNKIQRILKKPDGSFEWIYPPYRSRYK